MTNAVIVSQPMFFPWVGIFEQIRLADIFIHYDDVQFPQGRSFISRVQIKTAQGIKWLTAPVVRAHKQLIRDVKLDDQQPWRKSHLDTLRHAYARAPCVKEMMALAEELYTNPTQWLSDFNVASTEKIALYLGLTPRFEVSSSYQVEAQSSEKLLRLLQHTEATHYVTGHGARNYLNHEWFEKEGIEVLYMDYLCKDYPQLYGKFTPYVSILDLIANCGEKARNFIVSDGISWKEFLACTPR